MNTIKVVKRTLIFAALKCHDEVINGARIVFPAWFFGVRQLEGKSDFMLAEEVSGLVVVFVHIGNIQRFVLAASYFIVFLALRISRIASERLFATPSRKE